MQAAGIRADYWFELIVERFTPAPPTQLDQ